MKLSKLQREFVKAKFHGRCAYCGVELSQRWNADHFKPIHRVSEFVTTKTDSGYSGKWLATGEMQFPENDTIDNLFPSCLSCNNLKGNSTVEDFRKSIANKLQQLQRDSTAYRHALRFGLITENPTEVEFYFEKSHGEFISNESK